MERENSKIVRHSPMDFVIYSSGLSTGLKRFLILRELEQDQVSLIDFSLPNERGFGDNAAMEIFNEYNSDHIAPPPIHVFEKYSIAPNYVITFGNRVDNTNNNSDLMAISRIANKDYCGHIYKYSQSLKGMAIKRVEHSPNLTPWNQEVLNEKIVNLPDRHGCVSTPEGMFFYYTLLER